MLLYLIFFMFGLLLIAGLMASAQRKAQLTRERAERELKQRLKRSLYTCETLLTSSPFALPTNARTILLKRRIFLLEELSELGEANLESRITHSKEELYTISDDGLTEKFHEHYPLNGVPYESIFQYCHNLMTFYDKEINTVSSLSFLCTKEKSSLEKALTLCLFDDYVKKGTKDKSLEIWGSARSYFEKALELLVQYPEHTSSYTSKRDELMNEIVEIQYAMWAIPPNSNEPKESGDGLDRMFDTEKSKNRWSS